MCIGEQVDKLPGAKAQPLRNTSVGKYIPTLGESVDAHYMRTNSNAEERHKELGVHQEVPDAPKPPAPPQAVRTPTTTPLKRRNQFNGPAVSDTMLTGSGGIGASQLNLGQSSLLGG